MKTMRGFSKRIGGLIVALLGLLGLSLSAVGPAQADIMLEGDPQCVMGSCTIGNIAPALITDGMVDSPKIFLIGLRDMLHIEMPGDDFDLMTVNIIVTLVNPSLIYSADVTLDFFFTDEFGQPVGPMLESFSDTLAPGGLLNTIENRGATAAWPSFQFHGFGIEVFCLDCIEPIDLRHVEAIELNGLGLDANVGVWGEIPEPSSLALFVIALGGLGFMARRRLA